MPVTEKLYVMIADKFRAYLNCVEGDVHTKWEARHMEAIERLCKEFMPQGSGFDNGTELDFDKSTKDKIVFNTSYHHMGEHGGYIKWTEHAVIITPDFGGGFNIKVTGRDYNDTKGFFAEEFANALNKRINQSYDIETEEYTFVEIRG